MSANCDRKLNASSGVVLVMVIHHGYGILRLEASAIAENPCESHFCAGHMLNPQPVSNGQDQGWTTTDVHQ